MKIILFIAFFICLVYGQSFSQSASRTQSQTITNTPTGTLAFSVSPSKSNTPSSSSSATNSESPSVSISPTPSATPGLSSSSSVTNSFTPIPSTTPSSSETLSSSASVSSSSSSSASPSNTPSTSPSPSATDCNTEQYYGLFITNNVFGDDDCVSCFFIGNVGSDDGYYCDDGIYAAGVRVGDEIIESSSRASYTFNSTDLAASYEFNGEYHSIVIIQENIFTFGWTCSIQESILECETFDSENQQAQTIEPPLLSQSGIDFTSLYELNNEEFGNFILDVDNNLLFIDNSNETVRILVEQVDCCKNNDCIDSNLTCDTNICVPTEDVAGVWEFICAYVSLC